MGSRLSQFRLLLHDMEKEMGLLDLTPLERDIYYVAMEVADRSGEMSTSDIFNHDLLKNASRPTIFRAISTLMARGILRRRTGSARGVYTLAQVA